MSAGQGLNQELARIEEYFNKRLTETQLESYHNSLKSLNFKYLSIAITNLIRDRKPLAGQFPTINDIVTAYGNAGGQQATRKVYGPIEDFEFPIDLMWKGFNILERTQSEHDFKRFADAVSMPQNDRARVIAKYKRAFSVKNYNIGDQLK